MGTSTATPSYPSTATPSTNKVPVPAVPEDEKWPRSREAGVCAELAQDEGDRLLRAGDEKGAMVALKIAALIRRRRDTELGPF